MIRPSSPALGRSEPPRFTVSGPRGVPELTAPRSRPPPSPIVGRCGEAVVPGRSPPTVGLLIGALPGLPICGTALPIRSEREDGCCPRNTCCGCATEGFELRGCETTGCRDTDGTLNSGREADGTLKFGRETDGLGALKFGRETDGALKLGRLPPPDGALKLGRETDGALKLGRPPPPDGALKLGRPPPPDGALKLGRPPPPDGALKLGRPPPPPLGPRPPPSRPPPRWANTYSGRARPSKATTRRQKVPLKMTCFVFIPPSFRMKKSILVISHILLIVNYMRKATKKEKFYRKCADAAGHYQSALTFGGWFGSSGELQRRFIGSARFVGLVGLKAGAPASLPTTIRTLQSSCWFYLTVDFAVRVCNNTWYYVVEWSTAH